MARGMFSSVSAHMPYTQRTKEDTYIHNNVGQNTVHENICTESSTTQQTKEQPVLPGAEGKNYQLKPATRSLTERFQAHNILMNFKVIKNKMPNPNW